MPVNSAVVPPARCTRAKTEPTFSPAAWWTVVPGSSVFQVTPCPPRSASMRRPVTMLVWSGRVSVCSTTVRASRVPAPSSRSRVKVGSSEASSSLSADERSPSTLITSTRRLVDSSSARRCAGPAGEETREETEAVAAVVEPAPSYDRADPHPAGTTATAMVRTGTRARRRVGRDTSATLPRLRGLG